MPVRALDSTPTHDTPLPDPDALLFDHDPPRIPEADLWFLPGPIDEPPPPGAAILDPAAWHRAEAANAQALARLALTFGEFDLRLRGAPGPAERLALHEAADLAWWAGARFPVERLGLWLALRTGATEAHAPALARAGWAARRLTQGARPGEDLAALLGRPAEALTDLEALLAEAAGLHPVTQAALLFHAWRASGPGDLPGANTLEAAVLAACHGARMRRLAEGAPFLPLAQAGAGALDAYGTPEERLAAWIQGAERAVLAALLRLDRLRDWRQRAEAGTRDLSGRVPGLLLDVLEAVPFVHAALAEDRTGASRAAVQRNLELLAGRGLVREVTGQGRFRVWVAGV